MESTRVYRLNTLYMHGPSVGAAFMLEASWDPIFDDSFDLPILVQGFDGVECQIHQGLAPYARARTDYKSIRLKNIDHELRDFVWKHFQGVLTASVLMPLDQTSMSMYTCTWPTITKSQLLEITEEAPAGKPKASSVDHRQQSIDQKLISAAKEGHHDLARYFLQDVAPRANPNATDIHGRLSFLPMR
ncbi:hypothetical protein HYQ45_013936 [Verticillium longisporum]|uniref:Uncharacterized protein n=1 Tax=Verticillium longisporum TaxID=100787 RepID=A0A8I2ZD99_VERLO|nr:hypothetical protein HYQ45_013936 [Verticillium longisporum]